MKKSTIFSLLMLFVLIPVTLVLGSRLPGRWFYLTSTLIVVELMIPFFFSFEARKPQPRELVTLAVMAAIGAVARGAFRFFPHFSPITAIIMITGIAFGPQAGFLTGAVSAFASNFFCGHGPWTPWQMMAYGMAGFLGGLLFYRKKPMSSKPAVNTVLLAVVGYLIIQLIVGPLLDLCHVFTTISSVTWEAYVAALVSGLPVNAVHGAACALTLLLFSRPLLDKLNRLQVKYGMMEAGDDGV